MVKRTGPTNYQLQELLSQLESKAIENNLWKRVMKDLKKPSRQRSSINVYKINKFAREGETILVPGKVLSLGDLDKKVDVAAVNFSAEARSKIIAAKGKTFTIKELLQQNPDGKKVRILG